jgi:FkbM family methyltransferase
MSTLRRAATTATHLACRTIGRRQVVRASRFVLRGACLDVPNDMRTNGEWWLQDRILELSEQGQEIHVVDAGANIGRWSAAMLTAARRAGRVGDLDLHAFEPSSYTFERLSEALAEYSVTLARAALCERSGASILHVLAPGAGTNSLHEPPEATASTRQEEVATVTLDQYAARTGMDSIALVKIDTEGHDLAVLRGARRLLTEQRIMIAQFEYNHSWIFARSFLHDAFELLMPLGYQLGKLTPHGVEFYPHWDADLETFIQSNYVACTPRVAERIPSVAWWKGIG